MPPRGYSRASVRHFCNGCVGQSRKHEVLCSEQRRCLVWSLRWATLGNRTVSVPGATRSGVSPVSSEMHWIRYFVDLSLTIVVSPGCSFYTRLCRHWGIILCPALQFGPWCLSTATAGSWRPSTATAGSWPKSTPTSSASTATTNSSAIQTPKTGSIDFFKLKRATEQRERTGDSTGGSNPIHHW